jgi:hypothetical protein
MNTFLERLRNYAMINILEQNVPTTASIGPFAEEGTSNNRTDNPYFEKELPIITPFRSQSVSDYLNKILHSMSSSVIRSLTDEITVRKTAFTYESVLALYERAFGFLKLKEISKSNNGLTQVTALRKLDELKNLPEDWDSYGADPISPNAIAKAKSIITSVMIAFGGIIGNVVQLTDVIPIADGGVQLEWIGPHAELEIEISPNGNIGLLYISVSEDRRNYEESKENSLNDIYTVIAKLIHSQYSN